MQKTPLYDEHLRIGGKIVDFNGWALPVQFAGIVKEHVHTRTQVSLFDCSHMGEYIVKGQDAIAKYDREIISDLSKVPLGRCRYGAILNEQGGILDDLITFRMAADELYVVTNAGPLEAVTDRFCAKNPGMKHISYETAKIDVQGPRAQEIVLKAGFTAAKTLPYFNATWTTWEGNKVLLSRTGYTGELGYELFMDNDLSVKMWQRFLDLGVEPAGLGARDTLRTEVGYNLSGQDFDSTITPLEANMESYIAWDTEFVGKSALMKKRDAGQWQKLVGIVTRSKQKPQHNFEVQHDGKIAGIVTSGTFGPSLGYGVGLARVPAILATPGAKLTCGPRALEIEVAATPFYKDGTCRVKVT